MSPLNESILIVDDERLVVMGLWAQLEDLGATICGSAGTADEAVRLARTHRPAVVLMDVRLEGDKDGVDAALAIHESPGSKVIFVTGSNEPATIRRIESDHASAVLIKPVSERKLLEAIRAAPFPLPPDAGNLG